jgi:hypothetical protein
MRVVSGFSRTFPAGVEIEIDLPLPFQSVTSLDESEKAAGAALSPAQAGHYKVNVPARMRLTAFRMTS